MLKIQINRFDKQKKSEEIKKKVVKRSNKLIQNVKITLKWLLKNVSHQKINILILLLIVQKGVPIPSTTSQQIFEQIKVTPEVVLSEVSKLYDLVIS